MINIDKVKQYVKDFNDKLDYYKEFEIALLISMVMELDYKSVNQDLVNKVKRVIGIKDTVLDEDLRYEMREIEKELEDKEEEIEK